MVYVLRSTPNIPLNHRCPNYCYVGIRHVYLIRAHNSLHFHFTNMNDWLEENKLQYFMEVLIPGTHILTLKDQEGVFILFGPRNHFSPSTLMYTFHIIIIGTGTHGRSNFVWAILTLQTCYPYCHIYHQRAFVFIKLQNGDDGFWRSWGELGLGL